MPEFRPSHCTRFRFRYSECRRCADACPHDAIELSDEGAKLNAERCQHCALCVSACHTQAWHSDDFKLIDILREAIKKPSFTLACEPSGLAGDAIVPCLGAVAAVWLAYMAKRGLPVTLVGSSHCTDCIHGKTGAAQLASQMDAVQQLLAAHQQASAPQEVAWVVPVLSQDAATPAQRVQVSHHQITAQGRRKLFKRFFRPSGVDAVDTVERSKPTQIPAQAIRAGAYMLSEQRELLQIVCQQKQDRPLRMGWHENLPLMQLSIQPGCTLCEACFRVCPTGAIDIVQSPMDWAITFNADRCVACEVCLEVCQPRVLDAQSSADVRPGQPVVTLISRLQQRCSRCDRHFVSVEPRNTCSICSDDEEAFDAIFGPD